MCGDTVNNYGLNTLGSAYQNACDANAYALKEKTPEAPEVNLSRVIKRATDTEISPVVLRLFLVAHWEKVAKLAHKIHEGANCQ